MYAKLTNNRLQYAPNQLQHNGSHIFNPPESILLELGYLPVTSTKTPDDAPAGQHYEPHWEKTETDIKQVWELVDDPVESAVSEPTAEERMEILEGAVLELSEILYA